MEKVRVEMLDFWKHMNYDEGRNYQNKYSKGYKNMKQHKTQILAALALAFCLGMVVPNAVFASEGGEDGIELYAEGTTKLATSADLYAAIQKAKTEANFAKYQTLYNAQQALAKDLAAATETQVVAARNAVLAIDNAAQVADMTATELNTYINSMKDYSLWAGMFGAINTVVEKTGSSSYTADLISQKMSQNDIQDCYKAVNAFNNRVTGSLADNIMKLYNRINSEQSMSDYRTMAPVLAALETLEDVNAPETDVNAALTTVRNALKILLPEVGGIDTMDAKTLAQTAEGVTDYFKYLALYDSMAFLREITDGGTNLTAAAISGKYSIAAQQENYDAMATAAAAIDPEITAGLWAYELPNTSAGGEDDKKSDVDAPNTGIVGLFESGALDMGTLTLIVSVAVAGIAGIGLIAKLYLKHKF